MPTALLVADLCIIPHYIDKRHSAILQASKDAANNETDGIVVKVLNIETCDVTEYIAQLSGCRAVASSTLHGLIFAASYGIPGLRILLSDKVAGGHFKFEDFYGGIGHPELYRWQQVSGLRNLPYAALAASAQARAVPPINLEPLWNSCPFSANCGNITRKAHVAFARRFLERLHNTTMARSRIN